MQLILSLSLPLSLSLSLSLMATTKKGRKSKRIRSFLCSFKGCFGISNKVSSDHGDRKPAGVKGNSPVNDQFIPAKSSEIVPSSKEIHVVEDDEEKINHELITSNKTNDITTSEKSKNKEESSKKITAANDTWTNRRKLSHSASLPALNQKRENSAAAAAAGEFDSTVGAVIVSVTLVVMIIWGKMCAILCTAAWFYFVPRIRAKLDESYALKFREGENDVVDFDSWDYKKRVVLQGLLHRNNQ